MKLWNYLKSALLSHPRQQICEKNSSMTFEEVAIFAEIFSEKLKGEKCCAILCNSEMGAALALLACIAAKVTALPLSYRYGEIHCKKILDAITPTAIITDGEGELQVVHITDSDYQEADKHPSLIMCTSGTTGSPKGIMLSEKNIISNVVDISHYFDIDINDRILISRPLYHCAVLTGEFLLSIIKGCRIYFYSGSFNPVNILKLIADNDITVFCGTPTSLNTIAKFKNSKAFESLSTICVSGECMNEFVAATLRKTFTAAKIYHVYGMTEACPRISYLPPAMFESNPLSVGKPLDSVSYKIVKRGGKIAKTNETGVLWVRGPNVMLGYYANPELTSKALKRGWLCTGDIAKTTEDGLLQIMGRSDNLIIKAGMNIYPQEVEGALLNDPRVNEVLVYPLENALTGTQIGIKISGNFSNTDEVRQLCIEVLPSFQIPQRIDIVDELPKSASGKIIRGKA